MRTSRRPGRSVSATSATRSRRSSRRGGAPGWPTLGGRRAPQECRRPAASAARARPWPAPRCRSSGRRGVRARPSLAAEPAGHRLEGGPEGPGAPVPPIRGALRRPPINGFLPAMVPDGADHAPRSDLDRRGHLDLGRRCHGGRQERLADRQAGHERTPALVVELGEDVVEEEHRRLPPGALWPAGGQPGAGPGPASAVRPATSGCAPAGRRRAARRRPGAGPTEVTPRARSTLRCSAKASSQAARPRPLVVAPRPKSPDRPDGRSGRPPSGRAGRPAPPGRRPAGSRPRRDAGPRRRACCPRRRPAAFWASRRRAPRCRRMRSTSSVAVASFGSTTANVSSRNARRSDWPSVHDGDVLGREHRGPQRVVQLPSPAHGLTVHHGAGTPAGGGQLGFDGHGARAHLGLGPDDRRGGTMAHHRLPGRRRGTSCRVAR